MDETTKLLGRLDALEFMVTTVIADALATQPDIGSSVSAVRDFYLNKAQTLKAEAEFAGEPDGWRLAAFADALLDRTKDVVQMTVAITGGAGRAS